MAKNDEKQNNSANHISFAKRLKRWLMWLILAAIAAGGFYVAYLENRLPWLNAPQTVVEPQQQPALQQTSNTAILTDKVAVLEGQVKILNNKIIALQNAAPTDSLELVKNIDARLAQIEEANNEAIAQIMAQVATENKETSPAKPTSRDILLASGALIVRDMAEQGLPFAYEAEVLQILAQGNPQAEQYAATAQQFAASGLQGAPALIREFNKLYPALNDVPTVDNTPTETTEEPQTWYAKTWQWFKNIAVHRKKMAKPEFNATEDEVYQLVNAAKFAEALNVLKTDSQYNRISSPALEEWQKQASDYVAFDTAMRGLIMNALANIRLQEMQH